MALPLMGAALDHSLSPTLADIIGARRVRTAEMILGVDPLEVDRSTVGRLQ